jgi:hypothetical protein
MHSKKKCVSGKKPRTLQTIFPLPDRSTATVPYLHIEGKTFSQKKIVDNSKSTNTIKWGKINPFFPVLKLSKFEKKNLNKIFNEYHYLNLGTAVFKTGFCSFAHCSPHFFGKGGG